MIEISVRMSCEVKTLWKRKQCSPSVSLGLLESLLLSDASMSASLTGDERTPLRVMLLISSRFGSADRLSRFLTEPVSNTSRYVITSFFSFTFWSKDLETNAVSSSITAPKKNEEKKAPHNLPFRSLAVYHKNGNSALSLSLFLSIGLNARWWCDDEIFDNSSCCGECIQTCCRFTIEVTLFILSEASAPWSARITFPHHEPPSHRGGMGWRVEGGTLSVLQIHITPLHGCYWPRLTRGAN